MCVVVRCPDPTEYMFPTNLTNASRDLRMVDIEGPEVLPQLSAEVEYGRTKEKSNLKLNVFMGGRIAMRRAINILHAERELFELTGRLRLKAHAPVEGPPPPGPILATPLGAPKPPPGFIGSISHKERLAAAVAMNMHPIFKRSGHIGVDIEKCTHNSAESLSRRLLTANEITSLDGMGGLFAVEEEILLRFSFKEAIYKALNPFLKRYIEFHEAEVFPKPGGKVEIKLKLKTSEKFNVQAEWRRIEGKYWLTCVYAWEQVPVTGAARTPQLHYPFAHGTDLDDI